MAKRRPEERDAGVSTARPAATSPFAALAGLRDALPAMAPAAAPAPAPALPAAKGPAWSGKLVVQREKKGRGGKTVTRIRGLAPARLESVATQMKKALGCGATIEDGDVVLLGSLVERAAAWLRAQAAERVVEGN